MPRLAWEARPFKTLSHKDIQILVLHSFWCNSFLQLCLGKGELNYHFSFFKRIKLGNKYGLKDWYILIM